MCVCVCVCMYVCVCVRVCVYACVLLLLGVSLRKRERERISWVDIKCRFFLTIEKIRDKNDLLMHMKIYEQ